VFASDNTILNDMFRVWNKGRYWDTITPPLERAQREYDSFWGTTFSIINILDKEVYYAKQLRPSRYSWTAYNWEKKMSIFFYWIKYQYENFFSEDELIKKLEAQASLGGKIIIARNNNILNEYNEYINKMKEFKEIWLF